METSCRLRFGAFELDVAARSLTRQGAPVDVQPRVFDLLVYLIENRHRVVPTSEILDAVWGGVAVTTASLSQAIHKARTALGEDGEAQGAIATAHGHGFRFVAPVVPLPEGLEIGAAARDSDFVGRRHELARLAQALERARSGRGGLALLVGEPGIGKTRTALEFAASARTAGAEVAFARCPDDSGAPSYWPWRELGRALAKSWDPVELARLAGREAGDFLQVEPGLAALGMQPSAALAPAEMRFRLFESVLAVLRRMAAQRPLILIIDDVHVADVPSLVFLRYLADSLAGLPVLVVLTSRDAEIAVDAERRALLADSVRAGDGETLALRALAAEEVARLAERRLGRPLAATTLAALGQLCGGNPFYLGELLRLIGQRGEEGLSAAGQPGGLELPPTVRSAVEVQLRRLGHEATQLLSLAAVLGTGFTLRALVAASGLPQETVLGLLGRAAAEHVLEALAGSSARYRFAHALLREALYEDLEETARAQHHLRVARALEALPDADPAELAFHYHRALAVGGAEPAVVHACRAARIFQSQLAFERGALHLERALEALAYLPADAPRRRCEILLDVARAAAHTHNARAGTLLLEAAAIANALPAAEARPLLLEIAQVASDCRLAPPALRAFVKETLDSLPAQDAAAHAELLAAAGRGCLLGDPAATALARRAVELARRSAEASALSRALCSWHWVEWKPENRAERWAAVQEIERLGSAAGHEPLLEGRFLRAFDALEVGDRGGFLAAVEDLEAGARETRHPLSRWRALMSRSALATISGEFGDASRLAHDALLLRQRHGIGGFDAYVAYRSQQARSTFLRHEIESLGEDFRLQAERAPAHLLVQLSLVNWQTEMGELEAAREGLSRRAREDLLAGCGDVVTLMLLAQISSRVGDQRLCEGLLPILLRYRGLDLVEAGVCNSYGPAARFLGQVSWALGEAEAAAAYFEEALELCRTLGATAESLHVRLDYAEMLAARGRGADRRAALRELAAGVADANRLGAPAMVRRLEALRGRLGG